LRDGLLLALRDPRIDEADLELEIAEAARPRARLSSTRASAWRFSSSETGRAMRPFTRERSPSICCGAAAIANDAD
jgi:hypothetical protein